MGPKAPYPGYKYGIPPSLTLSLIPTPLHTPFHPNILPNPSINTYKKNKEINNHTHLAHSNHLISLLQVIIPRNIYTKLQIVSPFTSHHPRTLSLTSTDPSHPQRKGEDPSITTDSSIHIPIPPDLLPSIRFPQTLQTTNANYQYVNEPQFTGQVRSSFIHEREKEKK